MRRVWVLDTETKGTGARMAPLEDVLEQPAPAKEPFFVAPKRRPRPPAPPQPRPPRSFKVVDVLTQEALADGADARTTLNLLAGIRSQVDVCVSVWEPELERWRLLTLDEQRALFERARGSAR